MRLPAGGLPNRLFRFKVPALAPGYHIAESFFNMSQKTLGLCAPLYVIRPGLSP